MKMSYEMNFEMCVGSKEQRAEVLAVANRALIEKGYEKFANNLVADQDDDYMIAEDTCMTFLRKKKKQKKSFLKIVKTSMELTQTPKL